MLLMLMAATCHVEPRLTDYADADAEHFCCAAATDMPFSLIRHYFSLRYADDYFRVSR